VAISVDYRIGFPKSDGVFLCTANTDKDMREAMCRATQDAFAAVRYVKSKCGKTRHRQKFDIYWRRKCRRQQTH
jgi:hypothetical protein